MELSFVPHFQTKRERCTAPLCYKVILQFLRCFIQVSRLLHQFVFLTLSHFCRNFLGKEAARQRSDAWRYSEDIVTHVSKTTIFQMTVSNILNFKNGILPFSTQLIQFFENICFTLPTSRLRFQQGIGVLWFKVWTPHLRAFLNLNNYFDIHLPSACPKNNSISCSSITRCH